MAIIHKIMKLVHDTDWKLLQVQKETLVRLSCSPEILSDDRRHLTGMVNFIDYIQDIIVDSGYKTEEEVFGFKGSE